MLGRQISRCPQQRPRASGSFSIPPSAVNYEGGGERAEAGGFCWLGKVSEWLIGKNDHLLALWCRDLA